MSTLSRSEERSAVTLERAVVLALVLHAALFLLADRWQQLLVPAVPQQEQERPIEFRFVDTPDRPEVEPETETLSDRDRRAADDSPRDDRPDPFAEGNTEQAVLRAPEPATPAAESPPPQPAAQPAAQPTERAESTPPEEVAETGASKIPDASERAEAARAETESPPVEPAPATLPPRPHDLSRSLARLESFVDEQAFDNPTGGADDSSNLARFDTRGYDLGPYLRRVVRQIETNWRSNIPPLIRTGVGGATFVNLSIRRQRQPDGSEVAVLVAERTWQSGQPAYDSAALFSLELSNPLPPIPSHYPHEEITGRLGFIYNMDAASVVFPEDG